MGFPGTSVGKESTYNGGHPGSIPGLRRSTGEGNSDPLQDSGLDLGVLGFLVLHLGP